MTEVNQPARAKKAKQPQTEKTVTNAVNHRAAKPRLKCPADASEVKYVPAGASLTKVKTSK